MNNCRGRIEALIIVAGLVCSADSAEARCRINTAGLSASPLAGSTGTYAPPTAPSAQPVNLLVSGTYDTNGSGGTCNIGFSFYRSSLPASMARSGGGATMAYTVQTTPSGGNTLLYTGGFTPPAGNYTVLSFASAGPNLNNFPFSVSLTVYFLAQPVDPQQAGGYTDSLFFDIFNIRNNGSTNFLTTFGFSVSGGVTPACTIAGASMPADDSATIPVDPSGNVSVAPIVKSYATVLCNSTTNLLTTSLGGAVKTATAATGGFTNIIDYSASALYGGAASNLNTATISAASGPESGTTGTTSSPTSSGNLQVVITPQTPGQGLHAGAYADTLRITLAPQ